MYIVMTEKKGNKHIKPIIEGDQVECDACNGKKELYEYKGRANNKQLANE